MTEDKTGGMAVTTAEVDVAARAALQFLTACINGAVDGATVDQRIAASGVVLGHLASRHDLLAEVLEAVGLPSDADLGGLAKLLE